MAHTGLGYKLNQLFYPYVVLFFYVILSTKMYFKNK